MLGLPGVGSTSISCAISTILSSLAEDGSNLADASGICLLVQSGVVSGPSLFLCVPFGPCEMICVSSTQSFCKAKSSFGDFDWAASFLTSRVLGSKVLSTLERLCDDFAGLGTSVERRVLFKAIRRYLFLEESLASPDRSPSS